MLTLDDLIVIARTGSDQNFRATIAELVALVGGGGTPGPTGPTGPAGLTIPGWDGSDGEDGSTIPGRDGKNGLNGLTIPGQDGEDASDFFPVPGPKGDKGDKGDAGASGGSSSSGPLIWIPEDPEPDYWPLGFPYERNNLAYLGKITGTGVTVGPLIWTEDFDRIYFEWQIGGYNGGTPVGRHLIGSAAITTTGLTNASTLISNVTLDQTSVSKPGCPLAVTLSAIARSGWGVIRGASGALKQIDYHGMSGNPAVGTAPTSFEGRSFFSDLGTNLPIKRMQLTVYDTLIATAASAQAFIATTYIRAWGVRIGAGN